MAAVLFDLDDTLIVEEDFARENLALVCAGLDGSGGRSGELSGETGRGSGRGAGEVPAAGRKLASVVAEEARRQWRCSPFADICRELGFASWEGLWSELTGCHRCLDGLADWARDYREAVWRRALVHAGQDPERWKEPADHYVSLQRAGHPPLSDAIEVVRGLAGTVPLGLVTNGPPDIQRLKVHQAGLDDVFQAVVVSGEAGVGKPDPAIFTLALDRLGAAATDAVMVGNSWERDVAGARSAGLRAVWVDRGEPLPDGAALGDDVVAVRAVQEARPVLAEWALSGEWIVRGVPPERGEPAEQGVPGERSRR